MESNHPLLVTVVVPIYNVEKTITRCVQSILTQSYPYIEILLIDDATPDHSENVCKSFLSDNRVHYIKKENGGLSSVRNLGIELAKGDYICFVDGDDWVECNFIESLITPLQGKGGLSVCTIKEDYEINGNYSHTYENKVLSYIYRLPQDKPQLLDLMASGIMNSSCNKCFDISVLRKYNLRFPNITIVEDFYFVIHYLTHVSQIFMVDATSYHYIKDAGAASLTKSASPDMFGNYFCIHKILYEFIQDLPVENTVKVDRILFYQYYSLTLKFLNHINEQKVNRMNCLAMLNANFDHQYLKRAFKTYKPFSVLDFVLFQLVRSRMFYLALLFLKYVR